MLCVTAAGEESSSRAAPRTLTMAHACGMTVAAEGVETRDQAAALLEMGCDMLQGYLYSRLASPGEFAGAVSIEKRGNKRRAMR
jgi:EAL domain-containing protein (putative c-di-GMP-specific phosphodiesterase class I)